MKRKKYSDYKTQQLKFLKRLSFLALMAVMFACSDFVEVEPPKNVLISETVFNDPATVESALANIFYKIMEQGMVSGRNGLTSLMGIYSDELDYYGFNVNHLQYYNHNLSPSNTTVLNWWSSAYNAVYAANDIISGVDNSSILTLEEKNRFRGQALFIRAYIHSLLLNIYGDVPYITTTNYLENNSVSRTPTSMVVNNIISDLTSAETLLEGVSTEGEHILPSQSAVRALLARTYLYTEEWDSAETTASQLINTHSLEPNISSVFLKGSQETLWQLKPGDNPVNTHEANELTIQQIPGQRYALTHALLDSFEAGDLRLTNWIGSATSSDGSATLYFAQKYKATFTETESLEYSIIFRLAEQYLIRAEARARLGNISGAQQDLNTIRNRAGLTDSSASSVNDLLDAILHERRVELFCEQGQRWSDLKRTGNAASVLSLVKPNWQETDVLLPIPESELEVNPNLLPQNSGY
ncbi:MAG: RagB/SusD family nutrient uptake outer membrane protein [Allomuricauda sp.]